MKRYIAVSFLIGLAAALVTTPPAQAAGTGCKKFVPKKALPDDAGKPRTDSLKAPVITVTDAATKSRPITRRYEHGRGLVFPFHAGPEIVSEHEYFNLQVVTKHRIRGLYVRIDWPRSSTSDIDLYVYDEETREVGRSESWNNDALDNGGSPVFGAPSGGAGFEFIRGAAARPCQGFMVDSQAGSTLGEKMRLTVWLEGKVNSQI